MPNVVVVPIGHTVAEMWPFFIFKDDGVCHLEFLKFEILKCRLGSEG